jgi:hypothetical protein
VFHGVHAWGEEVFDAFQVDELTGQQFIRWDLEPLELGAGHFEEKIDEVQDILAVGLRLCCGKLVELKVLADDFLFFGFELVEIFLEDVLAVDFRDVFLTVGVDEQEVLADEDVDLLDAAGEEEVGELHCEGGQGAEVAGAVVAEVYASLIGGVAEEVREVLCVFFDLEIFFCLLAGLQLGRAQLLHWWLLLLLRCGCDWTKVSYNHSIVRH